MEKRYFLIGYIYTSKKNGAICTGHSTMTCRDYPARVELEKALTEENKINEPQKLSIVSVCEQTEAEQLAFLRV